MKKIVCMILILIIFFCSGCSWFADNRVRVANPRLDTTSPKYQKMLSNMINKRYEPDFIKCLVAEKEYQEYLMNKDKR